MNPSGPALPPHFFEDFKPGAQFVTGTRVISGSDVMAFAHLTGDTNPLHTDPVYARNSRFGQPIAHGLLGLSVASGLFAELGIYRGTAVAFLGIDHWTFHGPIFFGDEVRAHMTVTGVRRSDSRPEQGIVSRNIALVREGETLQSGSAPILMRCRSNRG